MQYHIRFWFNLMVSKIYIRIKISVLVDTLFMDGLMTDYMGYFQLGKLDHCTNGITRVFVMYKYVWHRVYIACREYNVNLYYNDNWQVQWHLESL